MPPRRAAVPVALLLAFAVVAAAGCSALAGAPPARPVVVEGIVVPGETWRVDPLDGAPEDWTGTGLAATITLESGTGERIEVVSDENGRFRAGPIILSGTNGDRLEVACPGRRGLCLSALDIPKGTPEIPGAPAVVRWRITLPDLQPAG